MSPQHADLDRAAFYLCLGRAFATPSPPAAFAAMRDALAADLTELAAACGYRVEDTLAALRECVSSLDAQQLLASYARLFLIPGERHPSLNTGAYLDGALGGGSAAAIEACYARCGLEKHDKFADLPDHVSVQLEFVAWLFAAEAQARGDGGEPPPITAREFLTRFVARWANPFRADIDAASARFGLGAHPYGALARVLEAAVVADTLPARCESAGEVGIDPEIVRLRAQYAGRTMGAEDVAFIRARLEADGLPSGHVAIPVDARDRVMGLAAMRAPEAPRHSGFFAGASVPAQTRGGPRCR